MAGTGLFLCAITLTRILAAWGANCGVPTGSSQLSDGMWQQWHNRLNGQIMQLDAPNSGGIDLLFYGDSLTELWRGTAWGYNSRLGGGIPDVFNRYFGQYTSVVCGAGGDTTANLWWRIQNGELPRNHQPKVAVVLIGANDLTVAYGQCGTWDSWDYYGAAATIAQQIAGIVGTIHGAWPGTRVIVMGVLPRGTDYWNGGADRWVWPNALSPGIDALNSALQQMDSSTPQMTYLYCGAGFTTGSGLNQGYLQDGQHPSVAGYEAIARCLQPVVAQYVGGSSSSSSSSSSGGGSGSNGGSTGGSGSSSSRSGGGSGGSNGNNNNNRGGPGGGGPGGGGPRGPGSGGGGGGGDASTSTDINA